MKHGELNKALCIFLIVVIVLPLFSSLFNSKEGLTTKTPCIVDKSTTITVHDINSNKLKPASKYDKGGCDKLEKTDKCDEFYMKFDKKYHPCEIFTKADHDS